MKLIKTMNDCFVCIPQLDAYYDNGLKFGAGIKGSIAERVHSLGLALIKPSEAGLFYYFKSKQFAAKLSRSLEDRVYQTALCIAGLALLVLGSGLYSIGRIALACTQSLKKDFVWVKPKKPFEIMEPIEQLHIMTFNLAGVPDWLAARNYVMPVSKRIAHVMPALEKECEVNAISLPDIMCFQEMFDERACETLALELKKKGYDSLVYDVGASSINLNSGLFLASKYPLSDVAFYPHPIKGGIEQYANKGLLIATVHVGDKRFIVANTHLNGGAPGGGYLPRAIQIKAIQAHLDRYIQQRLDKGQRVDGAFLSGDMNIAPIDTDKDQLIFEFEWYLHQLIADPEKAATYLNATSKHYSYKKAVESLKQLELNLPKAEDVMNPKAWEKFLYHVQSIRDAGLFKISEELETFLEKELPLKKGGPLSSDRWHHDVTTLDKALEGSSLDMETSYKLDSQVTEPKRLDYNFVRSKKGLEDSDLFFSPKHITTQVLSLKGLSDHFPVCSHFCLKND